MCVLKLLRHRHTCPGAETYSTYSRYVTSTSYRSHWMSTQVFSSLAEIFSVASPFCQSACGVSEKF